MAASSLSLRKQTHICVCLFATVLSMGTVPLVCWAKPEKHAVEVSQVKQSIHGRNKGLLQIYG
jgi:hypothetical protein